MKEWLNEWKNGWMNKRINDWMNKMTEWKNECNKMNEVKKIRKPVSNKLYSQEPTTELPNKKQENNFKKVQSWASCGMYSLALTWTDCLIFASVFSGTAEKKAKLQPNFSASVLYFIWRTKVLKFSFVTGYLSIRNGSTLTSLVGPSPSFASLLSVPIVNFPPFSFTISLCGALCAEIRPRKQISKYILRFSLTGAILSGRFFLTAHKGTGTSIVTQLNVTQCHVGSNE